MRSPLTLSLGSLLLSAALTFASPVSVSPPGINPHNATNLVSLQRRDGTLCDNLTNPQLDIQKVKRYIQDILFDPSRGIKDLTPEAREKASQISAALDDPLADVISVRTTVRACPAALADRTSAAALVGRPSI